MQLQPAQVRMPGDRDPVLLLGADSRLTRTLADELEALRAPVLRATSLGDALDQARDFERPPSVVLLAEPAIEPETLEEQLAELRIRAGATRLTPIAIGRRPDPVRRSQLREAGIHLALFGRFGRHALRFQLNRAISPFACRRLRGDLRAPMEWRTRAYSGGREKAIRCYSLSPGGAYFVTPRPWVVGADLSMELPIDRRRVRVDGRILYTKGAGSVDRPALPGGMAVAFAPLPDTLLDALRRDLTECRFGLEV